MRLLARVSIFLVGAAILGAAPSPDQAELRTAATRSLALLDRVNRTWLKQAYCYSCHNDGLFNRVHRIAREHGLPLDEQLALRSARKTYSWITNVDEAIQGYYFVDPTLVDGHELIAAHDAGYPSTLSLAAYARRLAHLQTPDGHWISSDRRPPQSHSQWSATEVSLEAIQDYLPQRLESEKRGTFQRAQKWLTKAEPESTEDRANQVLALSIAGAPRQVIAGAAKKLLAEQRTDGGWAQIPFRDSDAYATGLALYALHEAGAISTSAPAYQRGLRFLLDSQKTDGSWYIRTRLVYPIQISPPYMETGFPYGKDQIISELGTTWATIAIALAIDRPANAVKPYGGEPLLRAQAATEPWLETALFGTPAELKALLDGGLDPNVTTAGGTPLLLVVAPEPEKVRLVAGHVRDINVRAPRTSFNALMVAASHTNTLESVRILLEHGARVGAKEDPQPSTVPSALFLASGTAEPAKARLLIEHGDPISRIWTRLGTTYTVLGNAVHLHDRTLIDDLVKAGAPVNPNPPAHLTPLARAVTSNQKNIVRQLIALGADVNQADGNGTTPLEYAALSDYGDATVTRLLLTAGARPGARNKDGLTPLDIARKYKRGYLVRVLEQASPNSTNTGF
jgi:ankyrin repeat protein